MWDNDDDEGEDEEKDRRVGQFVADDFHSFQETSDFLGIFLLGRVGHGWCLLLDNKQGVNWVEMKSTTD